MEQVNNQVGTLMQATAMAATVQSGKSENTGDDFQKLLDKKTQSVSGKDSSAEAPVKSETAVSKPEKAAGKEEDSLSKIKKMLEQHGTFAFQPNWQNICIDLETGETTAVYNPGEWVMVFTGEKFEAVPTVDLEPWQQAQLKQILIDPNPIDVSDPKADAMLKATAPGADYSPAAILEKAVADQAGKAVTFTAEPVFDEDSGGEGEFKILDAEQAPQKLFHDVKAAPIKVAEPEQTQKTDVPRQLDKGIAQAIENGESTVRVELNPASLGSVTVEISRSAEGILKVALSAHSSETRGLLERHASDLQGLLGRSTSQTVEVEVQRQSESQQNQNQQNYDGHNGHNQHGQEQHRRRHDEQRSRDFAQQLRLGLIPTDVEAI
ncbi:MAG: flagellar hook-length control protein FliK [Butyricicoccus sp.]|nr:flagellar hook-length control protein FliK [Butyricicoccus sp.]